MVVRQCVQVGFIGQGAFFLGGNQDVLAEERHFAIPVLFVELDDFGQAMDPGRRAQVLKVCVQIGLELV